MKLAARLALVLTIPAASAASLAYPPSGGLTTVCYGLTCGTTFQAQQPMTVTGLATFTGNFFCTPIHPRRSPWASGTTRANSSPPPRLTASPPPSTTASGTAKTSPLSTSPRTPTTS